LHTDSWIEGVRASAIDAGSFPARERRTAWTQGMIEKERLAARIRRKIDE
jgi:hypothetical protein